MNIPTQLTVGDSASWTDDPVTLGDGRVADALAWSLKYVLRGPASLDVNATAAGTGWNVAIGAVASAALGSGLYRWAAQVANAGTGERFTVGSGQLTLAPDPAALQAGFDPRSPAQKALEACEAAMATFNATGGKVKKYEIAGRMMEFQLLSDLLKLRDFWATKVANEQQAAGIASGLRNPRNLYVRFRNPNR